MLLKALFGSPFFNILASVLATFIVGALFFKYGGGVPINVTSTMTEMTSTFDVSGEGKVVVIPDEARVRMGIRKSGASVSVLQEEVNTVMSELVDELGQVGIKKEDIKTTSYSVNPDYQVEERRSVGYVAYAEVEVRVVELQKTGEVLDLVGELGLEQVGGLTFGLSDELEKEAMREARELAIDEAKEKAEELAQLAGMKLARIVNVSESGSYPRPYIMNDKSVLRSMDEESEMSVPTQIEPGSSEIVTNVTLSYETR